MHVIGDVKPLTPCGQSLFNNSALIKESSITAYTGRKVNNKPKSSGKLSQISDSFKPA